MKHDDKGLNALDGACRTTRLMSERLASDIIDCDGMLVIKLYASNIPKEIVEEEMRLTSLARECGIRAPQVRELIMDSGRWGFSYEKLEGPTYLDLMADEGADFEGLGRSLAPLHREIHEHTDKNMPALKDRLRATIEEAEGWDELRKRALEALAELPDGDRICHGDFHPGNVIVTDKGEYILDWIDASAGHNLADVARTLLLILVWLPDQLRSMGIDPSPEDLEKFYRSYRTNAFTSTPESEELLDRWMFPVVVARLCQAIPGEEERLLELIERFSDREGRPGERLGVGPSS